MGQVAVCGVELEPAKPRIERSFRSCHEGVANSGDIGDAHLQWRLVALIKRQRARPDRLPSTLRGIQWLAAVPRARGSRLPARVGELNAGDRAVRFNEMRCPRQRFGVCIAPDSEILRRYP